MAPRSSPSSKLINRLQILFDLIQEANSWGSRENNAKKKELLEASRKVASQCEKEQYTDEQYLGPAIHTWLFSQASSFTENPDDIPDSLFVLNHRHAQRPPLLDPRFRKELKRAKKDSAASESEPPTKDDTPKASISKVKIKEEPTKEEKKRPRTTEKDLKTASNVKVKIEKGATAIAVKTVPKEEKKAGTAKEKKTEPTATFKADKGSAKDKKPSKRYVEVDTPTLKRPVAPSDDDDEEEEDSAKPSPPTDSNKASESAPPRKKLKSTSQGDLDTSGNANDDGDDYPGFWIRLPRHEDAATGDVRHDIAELIHNFKRMYSTVSTTKADYSTLLSGSEELRTGLRQLSLTKINPMQSNISQHDTDIKALQDFVKRLEEENVSLKNEIRDLSKTLHSLQLNIQSPPNSAFNPVNSYSNVPFNPQLGFIEYPAEDEGSAPVIPSSGSGSLTPANDAAREKLDS